MESEQQEEQDGPRITDKRKVRDGEVVAMPTADELLASEPSDSSNPVLAAQLAEEQMRIAEWDAMTDEERQAKLAEQAAQVQELPFQGGGVQAPPSEEAGKKSILSLFVVVIHRDGTAVATDDLNTDQWLPEFPVDSNMIYRSVCELKKDIESTDAATATLRFMNQHAAAIAQQQQAAALAGQLDQRGVKSPPRGRRR